MGFLCNFRSQKAQASGRGRENGKNADLAHRVDTEGDNGYPALAGVTYVPPPHILVEIPPNLARLRLSVPRPRGPFPERWASRPAGQT